MIMKDAKLHDVSNESLLIDMVLRRLIWTVRWDFTLVSFKVISNRMFFIGLILLNGFFEFDIF